MFFKDVAIFGPLIEFFLESPSKHQVSIRFLSIFVYS